MKIKTKKQLNLPQLIEWVWDNDVIDKNLLANNNATPLRINIGGEFIFNNDYVYSKNDTFTVEVEEEITEDTEIELLLEVRDGGTLIPYYNESIKSQVDKIVKEYHAYIDGEFKLIWRDGKLVE
ncbi:hypothetical protein [Staphylococcus sp. GDX8P106P-2]|uniref:hypothetical protein n=1 Tax=Staphylococcus sp. GDX8P106P-2 TaxID=2804108 RepID=UPI001AEC4612|nr:hypothetical protein [Staphylococcus sp. GDX8P106P-2]